MVVPDAAVVDPDGALVVPDAAVVVPDAAPPVPDAAVPWDEYEAEAGLTNAVVLPPSVVVGTVAAEMSGRSGVRLATVGDFVEFTAARAANALVVRFSIPDAGDATLNVYVDDTLRAALPLTPRYAWHYGLAAWLNGGPSLPSQDPAVCAPFHVFDEARVLLGDVPAGARVRLQKDVENAAADYTIDLIDLEWAPPPPDMPAGFLSLVADCGATPDDGRDDAAALTDCLTRGREAGRGVWIPAGRFDLAAAPDRRRGFVVDRNTVRGAGLWHSVLAGAGAGFYCTGHDCRFSDFALFGDTVVRDDAALDSGFQGSFGTGSALERVWIEHKKVGLWAGLDVQPNGQTDGLVVADCRIRNVFADGINLVNGTQNSRVTNTHLRGTGDDALAQWSYVRPGPVNRNNRFAHNTVQLPWRATCFALYGGEDASVEDSLCSDTLTFPGLQIGGPYPQWPFGGTTAVRRNTLTRAGGVSFNQKFGALKLLAYQVDQPGVVVEDIDIVDPPYFGLEFSANAADASRVVDATFNRVTIRRAGEYGIMVRASARGSATLADVLVEAPGLGGLRSPGGAAPAFRLDRGTGNVGF